MSVIKRDRTDSSNDLIVATEKFIELLETQSEDEAVKVLGGVIADLKSAKPGAPSHRSAVNAVVDAFEGELELSSYILSKPNPNEWTEAEELSQAAARVLNLARRLRT